MNLSGKRPGHIEKALVGKTRADLVRIIVHLASLEQHYTAAQIAARSGISKRTVLRDIHAGKFNGEFFKRADNQLTILASGVAKWRESFRVVVIDRSK